jgi:phosphohistidine phosphatase
LDALRASPDWPGSAQVEIERPLYLASTEALLDRLSTIEDEADCVLLVAHNPGIALLALNLAENRDTAALVRLRRGFPPAALATLEFDIEQWVDLETLKGRLIDVSAP